MSDQIERPFVNRCDGAMRPVSHRAASSFPFKFSLWLGLLFAVGVSGAYLFFLSDFMAVGTPAVTGLRTVTPQAAVSAVSRDRMRNVFASLVGPDNYFFWTPGSVSSTFAERAPVLAGATIVRSFSDRSISISVTEREPFGVWCPANSPCVAFDISGIAFAYVSPPAGSLIIRVDENSERTIPLGSLVFSSPEMRDAVVSAVSAVQESGYPIMGIAISSRELREWEIKSAPFAMIFSMDGIPDHLASVLHDLSARSDAENLSYLDFRVPGRVYYR